MRKRCLISALLGFAVALGGELAGAQKSSTDASTNAQIAVSELTKTVLSEIQDIEKRVNTIAEDFPAGLYNTYRPKGNEEVRTAAEILLHIAEQNESAASAIRTKERQTAMLAAGKVPQTKDFRFVSKQDTAAKVKASFAAVRKAIEDNPDPKNLNYWLYVISHGNGHFGNLATYYRINGLVPPTSRQ